MGGALSFVVSHLGWALLGTTLLGCGDPMVQKSAAPASSTPVVDEPTVVLVQTVPTETREFEAPGVASTHEVWLDMIQGASESIDVATFYVANHQPSRLEPILQAMEAAAERGVTVRLLVDASFAEQYPAELERLSRTLSVRQLAASRYMGGVQHAKYLIVDGRSFYLGSANFDWRALEHIHELGVRVNAAPLAHALAAVFTLDWALAEYPDGSAPRPADVANPSDVAPWPTIEAHDEQIALVASPTGWLPPGGAWDLPKLIAMIDGAEHRIAIELLNYDAAYRDGRPWNELQDALVRAAGRGVRVRLALSHWQPPHMDAVFALERVPGIEVVLIEVPEHSSGFIPFARVNHAKYLVVDGRQSWIGTSNWKADYFYSSRNVGLLVDGQVIAEQLENIFERVVSGPDAHPVDPSRVYEAPRLDH